VREEAQNRAPGYRHRVRALCTSLVTLVARQTMAADAAAGETEGSEGDRRRAYLVTRAKDYLLRHLDQPLTLGRVAAHVGVSEQHLARLFRQATGQTVFEYVRLMRFEAAKSYLSGSDRNVAEVARLTGFTSLPVFSRTFRREVGVSPSEYRRRVSGDVG
jgi:AraC-like DNA-binding protein